MGQKPGPRKAYDAREGSHSSQVRLSVPGRRRRRLSAHGGRWEVEGERCVLFFVFIVCVCDEAGISAKLHAWRKERVELKLLGMQIAGRRLIGETWRKQIGAGGWGPREDTG